MDSKKRDDRIKAWGREFFAAISNEAPSVFDKTWWTGKVMDFAMQNEEFKVQLFRFVDVLPCLTTTESLVRHIDEYFGDTGQDVPAVLKWGAKAMGSSGKFTGKMFAKALRANIETLARQFIIGSNRQEAMSSIKSLRQEGFAFTVDILGEATVSEEEENQYQQAYIGLLDELGCRQQQWPALAAGRDGLDWGHAPKINIAVKPTTLFSQADPCDFEGSVDSIVARFVPIVTKAMEIGAFVCMDMEQYRYKDITLEVYKRLRTSEQFRTYPHMGVVLQSYLVDTDNDLDQLLEWARQEELSLSVRLVKGAYWDYETLIAGQNGWQVPVYMEKAATDAAFERQAEKILKNHDICHLACASHNVRSIAAVSDIALCLNVPEERCEFQVLFGMAEPVRKELLKKNRRVRLYCPFGDLLPGMAYLVRRLLENTSNESFLRQTFAEGAEIERLLKDPAAVIGRQKDEREVAHGISATREGESGAALFSNEPAADFTRSTLRLAFSDALGSVRKQFGKTYPLRIGSGEIRTSESISSVNPAFPEEVVGRVCQAGRNEIEAAITDAKKVFPVWLKVSPAERAAYLFRAAEKVREQLYSLAAWQVYEVGKQWGQAHADIAEAIDFLEYYGREMIRLGRVQKMGHVPAEVNQYFYQPRGVAAVIAPWNFPFAISCGMCAAAMVAGNPVLFKPSGLSPVVGAKLAEIFLGLGLPSGVFNFVPAKGGEIGDFLVEHPDISIIAFTGSQEIGLHIAKRAAVVNPGQRNVKKVIAEMGGKNAIIVDDDADLDEAVHHVVHSAFAYQGQKCSACSRVIVLADVYDKFVRRLVEAASSIRIGPASDPANFMGPVVDKTAQVKIMQYIEIGKQEGTLLLSRQIPEQGFYVPLTIFGDIKKEHRLANEEIFGPILSVMKASTFDEALDIANSTPYALTGGVLSRSIKHLEQARQSFRVGNLYLNRGITGALVGRQPFGGFRMSGIGSKAGGPDYLLQFMEPRTVTENTMRRGFAPAEEV